MSDFYEGCKVFHRKLGEVKIMVCYAGGEKFMVHSITDDSFFHIVDVEDLSNEPFIAPNNKQSSFYVGRHVFHRHHGEVKIEYAHSNEKNFEVTVLKIKDRKEWVHIDDLSLSPFIERHTEDLQHGFYLVSHESKVKIGVVYNDAIAVFHNDMRNGVLDYTIFNDGELSVFQYLGENFACTHYKTVIELVTTNEFSNNAKSL